MLRRFKIGAVAGALAFAGIASGQQVATYSFVALPASSGSIVLGYPITITDGGWLLRQAAQYGEGGYAVVSSNGTSFHQLYGGAYVMAMNDYGTVVGDTGSGCPFTETNTGIVSYYGWINGRAWGLTDGGAIVGETGNNGFWYSVPQHALRNFNYPKAFSTIVRTISNTGILAGSYWLNGMTHGWIYNSGFKTVDFPKADGTYVSNVSNNGAAVGSYLTGSSTDMTEGGFTYKGGVFYRWSVPAPASSISAWDDDDGLYHTFKLVSFGVEPTGINDNGYVVGGVISHYQNPNDGDTVTQVASYLGRP